MALELLTSTFTFTRSDNDPTTGAFLVYYDYTETSWNKLTKAVEVSAPVEVVNNQDESPPPQGASRPTDELLDSYDVPADPAAPGYVQGAVGRRRRVYHNGAGAERFVDSAVCDLRYDTLQAYAPTSAGGFGYAQVDVATTAATVTVEVWRVGIQWVVLERVAPGRQFLYGLPASSQAYELRIRDSNGCVLPPMEFTIRPFRRVGCRDASALNYDPLATEDAVPSLCVFEDTPWDAVGGLMPAPVWLPIPVDLLDAAGRPRQGLYVEVVISSGDAVLYGRKQVRVANERFNAAGLLASRLAPLLRYGSGVPVQADNDAFAHYNYQYRAVDSTGPGEWQYRYRLRYVVLAAPAADDSDLLPYVTLQGAGRPLPGALSVFPEMVQFVGLPLETTLLVPDRPAGNTLYVELRYLDAAGGELEIRSLPVGPQVPAGVLRVSLPGNPLPCAERVLVALVDTNRAYAGSCDGVGVGVPDDGLLLVNDGFLKL